MGWTDWVTFWIALLGAALGAINTWHNYRKGKPRLEVSECAIKRTTKGDHYLVVELVNAGHIPVAINDVFIACKEAHQGRMLFLKDVPHHLWQTKKLDPGGALKIRSSTNSNVLDVPSMRSATGLTVQHSGAKFTTFRCQAIREFAMKRRADLKSHQPPN